jgi:hypothetical protein
MKNFDPAVMTNGNGGDFEYSMSKYMAEELWRNRKGEEKKMGKQDFFCHWVNTQLGLMGTCIGVKFTQ